MCVSYIKLVILFVSPCSGFEKCACSRGQSFGGSTAVHALCEPAGMVGVLSERPGELSGTLLHPSQKVQVSFVKKHHSLS